MRNRIGRAFCAVRDASGTTYKTSYTTEGMDSTTHFQAIGVKSPDQLEDDFLNLFIWIWSLKDHLKNSFIEKGLGGQEIEDLVNNSHALSLVADIANRAKHGVLRQSWSADFAELVDVRFEAPKESIERIQFAGANVTLRMKNLHLVHIYGTVLTRSGRRRDALEVLGEAMEIWEKKALPRISNAVG